MRPFLILIVAAALSTPVAMGSVSDTPAPDAARWIVGFHETREFSPGDQFHGATVVSVTPELRFITVETADSGLFQLRATLDENVRYIETDVSDHHLLFTPNDFYWSHSSNWGVKKIGAESAWDSTQGSTSVKDGHLDSGIVASHEDFTPAARFLQGQDFYQNDNTPQDESGCSWHGSHTTGTVAATINNAKGFAGMAQITVLPVKIFGGGFCFAASVTNLANALKYVGDQGAHLSSNSWGGGSFSTAIHDAITYSTDRGVIFVASAGNGGCNDCVGNPWVQQAANAIIVTATDANDNGASFNSKGPQVDVSAPGVDVGSAGGPGSSYYIMSGTSMAAPHVAGLVGLVKTVNPSWTRQQVTDQITSTAVDLGAAGHDSTFGWGRIDAAAALGGAPPPAPACSDGIDNDGDGLTDYPSDPGCSSATDDDETNSPPTGISLSVNGYKVRGKKVGDLSWSGATATNVDVYRNGGVVATTANDGFYTDNTGQNGGGTITWKVCEAGTTTCSNDASWTY